MCGRGNHLIKCADKESWITKNQVNMTPPKETNKAQITIKKQTSMNTLIEFRIVLSKKLSELQEHTDN